ncbi:MAG: hypothetical protein A3J65_02180 [Candidatus Buchananbacteria bacterium RIFCSPHIGHO2_02_FULL_45_11b]|uniref:GDYXXLXY domain-containing protein n=4 Tax=Candidatus Buchananiibacteriota TaxID=1817903 RepID=A0A1G1Y098_9BACT|nr:MAG: hypothetical protein A2663_02735 [Candidatus Buchananbacteria bacterium RIFCSPHIGHO2_01_FULL_46_12]OGY51979.1 MAG: hypothetical protein A3J65_02180 [Candidatus Buchananbacteria bacterium RIFCSPHIGHO2_02_FULL_45_11b]OGY52788.1 MAG: hypothetical protein A3B15_01425 [Candidatus Buchananbacteria bacterium RIFCSPLOWO2_01_FULL_45_31]OGY57826.1 MAG: hypothetical protein A3H67_03370 [Candidatus Buchananbacteria bacterium RIFCSPLOWO2_02_FULL_46_11b]
MTNKQIKFISVIVLQVAIIFAIIIFKLSILTGGTEILLKIQPLDPRDLLRGDYATFQYEISNLDSYYAQGQPIKNGDTVYVTLKQAGKNWAVKNIKTSKPAGGELFIAGKVESGGFENQADQLALQQLNNSRFHIIYGIEQYFIPEGEGRNFSFSNKEAVAQVAIDDNGSAVIKRIYVDGQPWP